MQMRRHTAGPPRMLPRQRQYCAHRCVVSMIWGIIAVALSLMSCCIHSTAWPSSKSSRSFSCTRRDGEWVQVVSVVRLVQPAVYSAKPQDAECVRWLHCKHKTPFLRLGGDVRLTLAVLQACGCGCVCVCVCVCVFVCVWG
jgi:hypothetical protein